MSSDLEDQKKLLLPILQRAEEIQAVEPRLSYYCRLYAIKKGLEIPKPAKEISGLIKATFAQCEKDKPAVQPNEETDRVYCENFALTVFRRADKVDRAGRADINTCKAFYAAAIFLQVLEQFLEPGEQMEDMAPDLLEKIRYALWRAAEIRKALREGRQPAPPPDGGAQGQAAAGAGPPAGDDLFAGPAYEQTPPEQQHQHHQPQPPAHAGPGVPDQLYNAGAAAASSAMDSVTSSADDFLSLPKPPSTVPPAGSTGLVPVAAAAGPRYRPGSKVWVVPSACSPAGGGGRPEEGTVGMVVAAAGGPGGQAVYKVALRDRLEELADGQLAPAVAEGGRLLFVSGIGQPHEPATVIAVNRDSWPVVYLLQLDRGSTLDTDGAHVVTLVPGDLRAGGPAGPATAARAGAPAADYPAVGSVPQQPPAAPPLTDPHTPPPVASQQQHGQPQGQGQGQGHVQQQHYPYQQMPQASNPPAAPPPQPPASQPPPPAAMQSAAARPQHIRPANAAPPFPASPSPGPAGAGASSANAAAAGAAGSGWYFPAPGGYQPSPSAIAEAQKYSKYAASSLAFDDVSGAIKYLTDALKLLTTPLAK